MVGGAEMRIVNEPVAFTCNGCGATQVSSHVADLGPLSFWYGIKSEVAEKVLRGRNFPSRLVECEKCRLVQQPPSSEIAEVLQFIYSTAGINNPSAAAGSKGWGAQVVMQLREVLKGLDPACVLEIGCGSGFLIDEWKIRGAKVAVGFEPSSAIDETPNGATVVRDYFGVSKAREFSEHFDLIYSFGVLEHLSNVHSVVAAAAELLMPGGDFIAEMPNGEAGLMDGDLGMFAHEHLNYFTPANLTLICEGAGLRVQRIIHNRMEIIIHARREFPARMGSQSEPGPSGTLQAFISKGHVRQRRIKDIIRKSQAGVAMYGACLGLCNINALLPEERRNRFGVIDSDSAKWSREVAGVNATVSGSEGTDYSMYSDIIVVPYAFQEEIYRYLQGRNVPCKLWRAYEGTSYTPASWEAEAVGKS